ncbi:MAG: 3-hydroxyisobutyrate dehydrogenase [Nisaea sp.]|jgi:3-hydroxyisobutyrate dehydrogenase|uniref:3-hydroxyisobutyrate dehydrogenase n=1 Tax=Nisaea sp. TaxID=2024842 RepID=UPI001B170345|nr:3-hydroxyisobutyrate dehydrogenase [Nisaea sp.]MBO6559239.1 3-hydroxyisobutyrate dehydrogenase [Nisaea sp.]
MTTIAFIGLGNMGLPMAKNLIGAGHQVRGFDLSAESLEKLEAAGGTAASSAADAVSGAQVVVTMLPAGKHVRAVYDESVFPNAASGTLFIDCSTIDVDTARAVAADAAAKGFSMLDAPVSGGTGGAEAGTLTFMVGGDDAAFAKARPLLDVMGATVVHAGASGSGQAAKICNNMVLGISMIAVSEAFALADKLGLDRQKLFDISSKSSGQCWAMTSYCPVPGPVPTSPANRDYLPGFTAAMMLKDLDLAQQAADSAKATTPMGTKAAEFYAAFVEEGHGALDFSAVFKKLRGN